jgi:RNA polymerase sigma-70 factor (ECF subfamily)
VEDHEIAALFASRDERALKEAEEKYGRYCLYIASHILGNEQDARECVNDTMLGAWRAAPEKRPDHLKAWLAAICRKTALDRLDASLRQKRGGGASAASLDELAECLSDENASDPTDELALREALNVFLRKLPKRRRTAFLQKYWYMMSVAEIARDLGVSQSAVKSSLCRTRKELKEYLKKEGIE